MSIINVEGKLDKVSMAASQEVEGEKFVKTADINLEVKDVYQSTISIENKLKEMGGFVTESRLNNVLITEKTFPISDEKATLVREYYVENTMQVRVPTVGLGDFLQFVSDKKLFLHHRNIIAKDVTANAKMVDLEKERLSKNQEKINQIKTNAKSIEQSNENNSEMNLQKISEFNLQDELKYSTVDIYLREPKNSLSEIEIPNPNGISSKYNVSFGYEIKTAFVDGFYVFQEFLIAMMKVWPFLLILFLGIYFWRNRKGISEKIKFKKSEKE